VVEQTTSTGARKRKSFPATRKEKEKGMKNTNPRMEQGTTLFAGHFIRGEENPSSSLLTGKKKGKCQKYKLLLTLRPPTPTKGKERKKGKFSLPRDLGKKMGSPCTIWGKGEERSYSPKHLLEKKRERNDKGEIP